MRGAPVFMPHFIQLFSYIKNTRKPPKQLKAFLCSLSPFWIVALLNQYPVTDIINQYSNIIFGLIKLKCK